MKSQTGSSKFDTVLKMLLIAFISLLAFSSGVYFGREMTEKDYQLKALESNFEDSHSHAAEKNKDYDVHEDEAVAAEDVEKIADQYVKAEKQASAHEVSDHHDEKSSAQDGHKKAGHSEVADRSDSHDASHSQKSQHSAPQATEHGSQHATQRVAEHKAPATGHHDAHEEEGAVHTKHDSRKRAAADHEVRNVASAHEVKPIVKKAAPHHDSDAEIAAQLEKASKTHKPDLSQVHEAARRVASNETPSVETKGHTDRRAPSSLPKSIGSATATAYTVQVASYQNLSEAKSHANELVKKGFPAYPVEANIKGKKWFRVSVGSFKSMREAGTYRTQLMKQATLPAAIVQKIER